MPLSEATEKVLIAALSAILGYSLGWLKDFIDRRRRTKTLATALLYDLRDLEDALHELMADATPSQGLFPPAFQLQDAFVKELSLFRPAAASAILDVYGSVRVFCSVQQECAAGRFSQIERADWWVQLFARRAAAAIHTAKQALEREGGSVHRAYIDADVQYPILPSIPARAFPPRSKAVPQPSYPIVRDYD